MKLSLFIHSFYIITVLTFQTARKYLKNTKEIVVDTSYTLNSFGSYLQTDLWPSMRTVLLRTFPNPSEASYEDADPTS
jgi:hypothetical protein